MQLLMESYIEKMLNAPDLNKGVQELVLFLGVTSVEKPIIAEFPDHGWGPSVVQVIAESHIAVHYSVERIYIDIFSCKEFDRFDVTDFCIERFLMRKPLLRCQVIERGFI